MPNDINVAHLAKLTNIPVSDEEVKKFSSQFASTLKTIATLEELNTAKTSATPQVTGLSNITRDDVVEKSRMFSQEEALSNAKQSYKGYFLVDAVINES